MTGRTVDAAGCSPPLLLAILVRQARLSGGLDAVCTAASEGGVGTAAMETSLGARIQACSAATPSADCDWRAGLENPTATRRISRSCVSTNLTLFRAPSHRATSGR